MAESNTKSAWKKFNKAVNDLARCVLCSKLFEHEVYLCTNSHNICHSCYHASMEGSRCGYKGCTGSWMNVSCRNLVLSKLSQLRTSLYAVKENMSNLHELPWMDLVQCILCYETCVGLVFSCQNGHIWCEQCQIQVKSFRLLKCPYCKQPLLEEPQRNKTVEEIIGLLKPKKPESAGPIRRKGQFPCPINGCNSLHYLQCIYVHLKTSHPKLYIRKEKTDFTDHKWYDLVTFVVQDYSAACHIYATGLFGLNITFLDLGRQGIFIHRAYLVYVSGLYKQFEYTLQVVYRTKRDRIVTAYIKGIASHQDTPEIAKERFDRLNGTDRTAGFLLRALTLVTVKVELKPFE